MAGVAPNSHLGNKAPNAVPPMHPRGVTEAHSFATRANDSMVNYETEGMYFRNFGDGKAYLESMLRLVSSIMDEIVTDSTQKQMMDFDFMHNLGAAMGLMSHLAHTVFLSKVPIKNLYGENFERGFESGIESAKNTQEVFSVRASK